MPSKQPRRTRAGWHRRPPLPPPIPPRKPAGEGRTPAGQVQPQGSSTPCRSGSRSSKGRRDPVSHFRGTSSRRAASGPARNQTAPPPPPPPSVSSSLAFATPAAGIPSTGRNRAQRPPARPRTPSPWRRSPRFPGQERPSLAASASNSSSSSRCGCDRFCGVSTTTCTYMSPRAALRSTEKPLPRRRNWSPVWVPARDRHARPAAIDDRHLHRAAERRLGHAQRDADEDVGPVALEQRVRADRRHRRRGRPPARRAARPRPRRPGGCGCRPRHPAGTETDRVRSRCTRPAPSQTLQGF